MKISKLKARKIIIEHQLPPNFSHGRRGALEAIEHLGYVQIDTISVVQRAHHHILWSRVPEYHPKNLHDLQIEREIFEYWSHAAAFLPMKNFRFSLPRMKSYQGGQRHWFPKQKRVMQFVLDRICAEGPLKSSDFESDSKQKSGPWFDWKPTKRALQILFMEGQILISERKGFQKVYDLTERVVPSHIDKSFPAPSEYAKHLIETVLKSQGIASLAEIIYLRRGITKMVRDVLNQMLESGEVEEIVIEGIEKEKFYVRSGTLEKPIPTPSERAFLLSPFDNLVIQRKRLQRLFQFDCQIECYVPAPKRKHGYFCLPILFKDEFVGRLDPKADRKSKEFLIKSLKLEKTKPEIIKALGQEIERFAAFNDCERLDFSKVRPVEIRKRLQASVAVRSGLR